MKKTLNFKKETIAKLDGNTLTQVQGGGATNGANICLHTQGDCLTQYRCTIINCPITTNVCVIKTQNICIIKTQTVCFVTDTLGCL
ncbi:MAG: class I lanthipeptide [Hyphomicrobiales bacterium]